MSGLDASNDVSEGGFWNNLRISADDWSNAVDITGAEKIMIDVILTSPATVAIAAIPQGPGNGWWTNPVRAVRLFPNDFIKQVDGTYKAVLTITAEDSPGLEIIGMSDTDNTIQNIVLFVGTDGTDVIYLDNFKVSGKKIEIPIIHDSLGEAKLPSDFEDDTRQGWKWSSDSAVQTALTLEEANGSKDLSWKVAYPEVKPSDPWASAPRLDLWMDGLKRGNKNFLFFDFYLAPDRASEGTIEINLAFQPPSAGYWAQASNTYVIDLSDLDSATVTNDGLYHYEAKIDLNSVPNIEDNTDLRNMLLIFVDVNSDFAGRMYIDNVNFIE
nr:carbohydrate-binding domain-containing protein [Petrotoga sibirica]